MRILQLIGTLAPSYGGPAIATPDLCEALAQRGHDVELYAIEFRQQLGDGVPRHPTGYRLRMFSVDSRGSYGLSPGLAQTLWRTVSDFDVVHIHSVYGFHTLAASSACRARGVPYLVSPHGALDAYHWSKKRWKKAPYERLIERRNLQGASAIIATSPHEMADIGLLKLRPAIRIVPQGVRQPDGWPGAYQERKGNEVRSPVIASIGRLTAKKGLDILIEAMVVISKARPDAMLIIAGPDDGRTEGVLRALVTRHGLSDRVQIVGPLYGAEKWELLARATVFVLPSQDESFGVAVAEAMTAGVPVVVSEGVALHDVVRREGAGLVVDRSADAVAEAVLTIFSEPIASAALGRRGRDVAIAQFSWPAVAKVFEDVCDELI